MPVALDELRHRTALLSDTRPDERHLVCQVEQVARPETLRHLELRRRLEQEHALSPALVDHVVNAGVFASLHKRECFLDLVQHRQRQNVYLGEFGVGHAVLVPVHDEAAVRGTRAYGHHLRNGGLAQHHTANVLAQHLGCVHELRG